MALHETLTSTIKRIAREVGFARVGITTAKELEGEMEFRQWVSQGNHADMAYLAENVEKRFAPKQIEPQCQSVICLAVSYCPQEEEPPGDAFVARYARGRDYHRVLKKRCHGLCDAIAKLEPGFVGRSFVDTAPVAERLLAQRAGLGFVGRNGLLIVPGLGSFVLLAEIFCSLSLEPDEPLSADCGDCLQCLETCPTDALSATGPMDARRCRSYQTIENRGSIPQELWTRMGNCLFGCDRCQSICPHNQNAPAGDSELLAPADWTPPTFAEVQQWTGDDWDVFTRGSARRRATLEMYKRNATIAAANQ